MNYENIVKKYTPKENKILNGFLSFFMGGLIGLFSQILYVFFTNYFSEINSGLLVCLIVIFVGCFLTSVGIFDELVNVFKMGLLLPTTGFAHAIMSTVLDSKKEGFITLGSNYFKLAGSVIVYGIIFAFIMGLIKVII